MDCVEVSQNEKLPVSLVVITLNEEQNIGRCLNSVDWVSDKVVLDSLSTDSTVEIAKSLNARVFQEAFRGFREQKARATEIAKYDWVLSLDADEALSPELSHELKSLMETELNKPSSGFDGVEMPRLSYYLGRWIRYGGWYPDWQLRLFHRKNSQWVGGHVHEKVQCTRTVKTKSSLLHWVFKDLSDQVATNNEYSTKGALDLREKQQSFSCAKLVFKPLSKFLETYIWKRGFLDGLAGFIIAVGAAYSVFLKFSKLWELGEKERKND